MLEMRKNIFLFHDYLSSSFLRKTFKAITYIRTNYLVFISLYFLQEEDLTIQKVIQSISSN